MQTEETASIVLESRVRARMRPGGAGVLAFRGASVPCEHQGRILDTDAGAGGPGRRRGAAASARPRHCAGRRAAAYWFGGGSESEWRCVRRIRRSRVLVREHRSSGPSRATMGIRTYWYRKTQSPRCDRGRTCDRLEATLRKANSFSRPARASAKWRYGWFPKNTTPVTVPSSFVLVIVVVVVRH